MRPGPWLVGVVFGALLWEGARELLPWTLASILAWGMALRHHDRLAAVEGAGVWWAWLAALFGATLLSWEPLNSVLPFWKRATGVVVYLAGCALWESADRKAWFWTLCAAAPLLGAAAVLRFLRDSSWVGWLEPNSNYTASVQAAWFAALFGALAGGYRGPAVARAAMVLGMAAALGLVWAAGSRGAAAAVLAALAAWALGKRWKAVVVAAAVAAAAGLAASEPVALWLRKGQDTARYARLEIWKSAAQVVRDRPWFGVGPGNFERGFKLHNFPFEDAPPYENALSRYGKTASHAHNELLQLAAEGGLGALALFLMALGRSALRLKAPAGSWEEEAGRLAAVALFAHSLVEGTWMLPALQLLFFSALAAGFPSASGGRPVRTAASSLVFAAGLAGAAAAWLPEAGARHALDRSARVPPGPEQALWLERALWVKPRDGWLWDRLARANLLSPAPAPGLALAQLGRAIELEPKNAVFLVQKADLMAKAGDRVQMERLASEALRLEPDFAEARLMLAEEALGRTDRARAAEQLGALEEVRRKVELALRVNPDRGLSLHERMVFGIDEARLARLKSATRTDVHP